MISDFKAGTKVCQAVLLRVQKIGNSSNGGVFARGLLEDNSGKMPFIVFEAGIVDKMRSMEGPKVMMVGGMVDINKFSNDMTLQLVLQRMEEIMPEDDITHLLPNGDFDHQEYENKLQKLIKGVMTPGIRLISFCSLFSYKYKQNIRNRENSRRFNKILCQKLLEMNLIKS